LFTDSIVDNIVEQMGCHSTQTTNY